MSLPRMRTLDQAYCYIKTQDPETALTKCALRHMILIGVIPSVMVGNKRLLNLDNIEQYLSGFPVVREVKLEEPKIRRIIR